MFPLRPQGSEARAREDYRLGAGPGSYTALQLPALPTWKPSATGSCSGLEGTLMNGSLVPYDTRRASEHPHPQVPRSQRIRRPLSTSLGHQVPTTEAVSSERPWSQHSLSMGHGVGGVPARGAWGVLSAGEAEDPVTCTARKRSGLSQLWILWHRSKPAPLAPSVALPLGRQGSPMPRPPWFRPSTGAY